VGRKGQRHSTTGPFEISTRDIEEEEIDKNALRFSWFWAGGVEGDKEEDGEDV
jgi:hypothetical protein